MRLRHGDSSEASKKGNVRCWRPLLEDCWKSSLRKLLCTMTWRSNHQLYVEVPNKPVVNQTPSVFTTRTWQQEDSAPGPQYDWGNAKAFWRQGTFGVICVRVLHTFVTCFKMAIHMNESECCLSYVLRFTEPWTLLTSVLISVIHCVPFA
jgi:hypothetical protein